MAAIIKCTNVRIFINDIKSQNMYIQVVWILMNPHWYFKTRLSSIFAKSRSKFIFEVGTELYT